MNSLKQDLLFLRNMTMKSFEIVVNASGMKIFHYVEAVDAKAAKAQGL